MADAPERTSLLADLNRQVMTLASAILALAATFATGVIGKSPDRLQLWSIGLAALFLLFSLCCALVANAKLLDYVKLLPPTSSNGNDIKKAWNQAAAITNLGFLLFVVSLLLLLGFAALRVRDTPSDAELAVRQSTDFLIRQGKIKSRDEWKSFNTVSTPDGDEIEVKFKSAAGVDYVCRVNASQTISGCGG
jgi:hypothetical protein